MSDSTEPNDVEYPDNAGYPDGEGVVGNGPTTEAVPSGVDPTIADEPEDESAPVDDDASLVENDG